MSRAKLAAARELIEEKQYEAARTLLLTIEDDPVAARWLLKLDERIGRRTQPAPMTEKTRSYPVIPAPPPAQSSSFDFSRAATRAQHPATQQQLAYDLQFVVAAFVRKNWSVRSQTESQASLEWKPSSFGLALLLGVVAVFVLVFYSILIGMLCVGGALLLIALNNATQRGKTAYITVTLTGVTVTSNKRGIEAVYPSGYRGKVRT